ncbi:hypothetical protein A2Y85_04490 [candidate division WOR-3 bacterium RBG_13_43_14]|uniref:DNA mismatch repair protein MutL n=1 Tax=candidate division WOR-3 bacterium RBG_13_43_14 TaxID=1802590 RepID=A0A1F4U2A7_UNCW3|nr:MAG: hypothetical protein A2Y85_04490 [candidate division WOR-3 bacterium RBG_13_43_14]
MARIKILSPDVCGKIAAGEVIIRPASVMKELVENSIDAESTRIDIELDDGGKKKCLVLDNGQGIAHDDVTIAVERYGTSKISTVDDIEHILTYGFRGEALASIAQVAQLEIETSDGKQGTKLEMINGHIESVMIIERPRGSKVKVTGLFLSLPARLKFLKSAEWERRVILDLVRGYTLVNPGIAFYLSDSSRVLLELPAHNSVEERLKILVSRSLWQYLVPINVELGKFKIHGFLSRPDLGQKPPFSYFFINKRPVKYPRLYRAILDAYERPKNPPLFVLQIESAPEEVDVNIHPTKNEVKIRDERYVVDILTQAIRKSIFKQVASINTADGLAPVIAGVTDHAFIQENLLVSDSQTASAEPYRESDEFWQLHNTYILAQIKSGMIIVDQHVAHERVIFESLMRGQTAAQRLLFPITLDLSPEEYHAYKRSRALLRELGVDFKEFSAKTVVLDSLPSGVQVNRDEIINIFKDIDALGNFIQDKAEIAKVIACRTSIMAGQRLTMIEMQSLIDQLFACENPYTCPHGRPVVIRMDLDDLASRFGR